MDLEETLFLLAGLSKFGYEFETKEGTTEIIKRIA